MRRLLILLTLLTASISIAAQEKPGAVKVDEFDRISCDNMIFRVEHLATDVANNPGSKGYFVIYPREGIPIRPYFGLEEMLRGTISFLKLDASRIFFVHAKPGTEQKVESWIVSKGAQMPDFPIGVWTYPVKRSTKIYDTSWPAGEVCPDAPAEKLASILNDNPTLRGHISINERSDRKYRKLLGEIKAKLAAVDASRIRFFRRRDCSADTCGRYQLWLIPTRPTSK